MTTEPRQVEVVCPRCVGTGEDPHLGSGSTFGDFTFHRCAKSHGGCGGSGVQSHPLVPDALTARMLDLAEAVDRWQGARDVISYDEGLPEFYAALAAYRQHKEYRRPE